MVSAGHLFNLLFERLIFFAFFDSDDILMPYCLIDSAKAAMSNFLQNKILIVIKKYTYRLIFLININHYTTNHTIHRVDIHVQHFLKPKKLNEETIQLRIRSARYLEARAGALKGCKILAISLLFVGRV